MKKITRQAVEAFARFETYRNGNTAVERLETESGKRLAVMILHGHRIASYDGRTINMNMCGWGTPTTRERLNGICNYFGLEGFSQRNHTQYYGEQAIESNQSVIDTPRRF